MDDRADRRPPTPADARDTVHARDVRVPRSLPEAEAALELAEAQLERLARRVAASGETPQLALAREGWNERRLEARWVRARLLADADPDAPPPVLPPPAERLRSTDVRQPRSAGEAQAAADLASTRLVHIEAQLDEQPMSRALQGALAAWTEKLAEVEWVRERLLAGAAPADAALEAARARIAQLEAERGEDVAALRDRLAALAAQRVVLLRQKRKSERRAVGDEGARVGEARREGADALHQAAARAVEALREAHEAGGPTDFSRATAGALLGTLPRGYMETWRADVLPRIAAGS